MIEATSCGGVVIFRGKILVLYKNYRNKYEGWVLPKGTVEAGEEYKETALREVKEETGVSASIIKYIGKSQYSFNTPQDVVEKEQKEHARPRPLVDRTVPELVAHQEQQAQGQEHIHRDFQLYFRLHIRPVSA